MIDRLSKPWFVYRPMQLLHRALAAVRPWRPGNQPLQTAWGGTLLADPTKTIGHSIVTTGVYDLAVSEALARLIDPGATVIDAGANVGYMTVLAAAAAGPQGRVIAFEPHPELFRTLRMNVEQQPAGGAECVLHQAALGEQKGSAQLLLPAEFEENDGTARIAHAGALGRSITVAMERLDDVLGSAAAAVLKIDVEGHEIYALRGARTALADGRIRTIVFEDHTVEESEVVRLLREFGYELFALGWSLHGPEIQPLDAGSLAKRFEAPNYLATRDGALVHERFTPRGWQVLSRRRFRRPPRAG